MSKFTGFSKPTENYSKLPHEFVELLPEIDSLAELKVILYILRHTWGFSEYDKPKKMTLDELQNGRKRRDGQRMDGGTGLSVNSIKAGAEKAVGRGILMIETDESDRARIEKWYCLNMSDESNFDTRLSKVDSLPSKVDNRTEKETIERKEPGEILKTDEEQPRYGTAYNRGEQERPDKIDSLLQMTQFPGAKKAARVDAMQSAYGVAFVVNSETKEWKKLAEYAIEKQDKLGWEPERFIKWVKTQQGYPQFWTARRMLEQYPKAYEEAQSKEQENNRSHAL